MTGSLQIKNNKYYIVLNIPGGGKRRQKWITTGLEVKGNKRKAEQLLRETLHEYELTPETVRNDVLFSDYIRVWLKATKRRVDEITYQGYEILANSHVLPYFEASPERYCKPISTKNPCMAARMAREDFRRARCGCTRTSCIRRSTWQ